MIDKNGYFESIVKTQLEKIIITNLDKDPESILELCLDYLNEEEDL